MNFRDKKHEELFNEICGKMRYIDTYHQSLAYLLALDSVCREHISEIYRIDEDGIEPNSISKAWQTDTSKRTTRLAFNLWNGTASDGETYIDKDGNEQLLPSCYFAPDEIFSCEYAPYYWQAIKLRYPQYV